MFEVRRALISVSDKRDLIQFAAGLTDLGVELLSTGGTCRKLKQSGIEAKEVSEMTGFPEIMGGRVKTLHPLIHGGLLGRRGQDEAVMAEHGIEPIDLLAVNLYPFEETIRNPKATMRDAIENIDIGGPAMIRAASKNHDGVIVIVDPHDYEEVVQALREGSMDVKTRRTLAAKAFAHTAAYDAAIAAFLNQSIQQEVLEKTFHYAGSGGERLRYGENPHQAAAFYRDHNIPPGSLASAKQLQGKPLSYNNIADTDAALGCVRQFSNPACVIVKHANPCGVAVDQDVQRAYDRAFSTDPTSAFGGIIAFNRELDGDTARRIIDQQFVEVIVAPSVDDRVESIIAEKKNVRLLLTSDWQESKTEGFDFKKVSGGLLVQTSDHGVVAASDLKVVTKTSPNEEQLRDLMFAWKVAKFVKSNAIVFCKDRMTIGVGAGQMSRVYSTKIAAIKAADEGLDVAGSVMASDAFFPFRDGIDSAAEHGISAIIQPGGSMRDDEVIAAADEHGLAMVFTGMRHFRH